MNPRRRPKRTRNPYRGSRAFDASCRNHGGCAWCEGNRLAAATRRIEAAEAQLVEAKHENDELKQMLSETKP